MRSAFKAIMVVGVGGIIWLLSGCGDMACYRFGPTNPNMCPDDYKSDGSGDPYPEKPVEEPQEPADCSGQRGRQASSIFFATSELYKGDLGGLEGADELCAGLAEAAGLKGHYVAWLQPGSRKELCSLMNEETVFKRQDGVRLALGWTRFTTEKLPTYHLTEEGKRTSPTTLWTGGERGNCQDWQSSKAEDRGELGWAEGYTLWKGGNGDDACDQHHRLYCAQVSPQDPPSLTTKN